MKQPARSRGAVVHADRAIRLRDRAEECRALARIIPAEAGAATYLRYAEDYEALADQEERLARDAAELEIKNQQSWRRGLSPLTAVPIPFLDADGL